MRLAVLFTLLAGTTLAGGYWTEVAQVPEAPSGKAVKTGGWMVESDDILYIAKGNKTGDFYSYNPGLNVWTMLPPWPSGTDMKAPGKGATACVDGNRIYATKGNNTRGFWLYDISLNTWTQLPDVPLGPSGKAVKGGTDMVYLKLGTGQDTGYVYLLKGYKNEFYRYNPQTMVWQTLVDAPAGYKSRWGQGSWLAARRRTNQNIYYIYAHKAKYHEMYVYDALTQTWGLLTGMPFAGSSGTSKKAKDGSRAVFSDGAVWALKGGNTCEFWRYDLLLATWAEREPVPLLGSSGRQKRVKSGGDIVSYGDGIYYVLKGNGTRELWRYTDTLTLDRDHEPTPPTTRPGLNISPGLTAGRRVVIHSPGLRPGPALVTIRDASGRSVLTRRLADAGNRVNLDLTGLSAGVYLVELNLGDAKLPGKVVLK
uniref:T9SS type A sorting domain-containing protein n=1 Tax=candidate division WOR-3 bacterium TaxID=2052148 RepID=A0A7C4G906_UNCW3